jgi:methyltransferase (TIGR00027 family)
VQLSPPHPSRNSSSSARASTRAGRLDALADTTVFEVDHPDTQALKRERAAAIPAKARQVRFVATDFHRRGMTDALRAAGYDVSLPTFWVWEGVTVYLRPEAVAANLEALAALSAPGSHLALTYMSKINGRVPRSLPGLTGRACALGLFSRRNHESGEDVRLEMHSRFRNRGLAARTYPRSAAYQTSSRVAVVRAHLGGRKKSPNFSTRSNVYTYVWPFR